MDHRLADTVWPDEFDVLFAILDDLPIQLQVHVFVVEGKDVTRTHRAVEIAFCRAFQRNLHRASAKQGLMAKIACRNTQPVLKLPLHCFQPSAMNPSVYARSSSSVSK